MANKYYTILERNAGESWAIAWGDYDRAVVKEELDDLKRGYNRAQFYKIVTSGDTQAEVEAVRDAETAKLTDVINSEAEHVAEQDHNLVIAVKTFDLDRYANGCEMVRCEIEADLVGIAFPKMSRVAASFNDDRYEYAASFCDQKMDLVAELFADRIANEKGGF